MKKIDYTTTPYTYYDMNGNKIQEGDTIIFHYGNNDVEEKVYLLSDDLSLGTDATNKSWIASGRAVPCEYGCYPLNVSDLEICEVKEK